MENSVNNMYVEGWLDTAALRLLQRVHQDDPDLCLQAQCNHRHSQYGKISVRNMATF